MEINADISSPLFTSHIDIKVIHEKSFVKNYQNHLDCNIRGSVKF